MLLIPLGPENREVRRWPWVTIGIVALNVLIFLGVGPAGRRNGNGQRLADRWGFVAEHPSLVTSITSAFLHWDGWHLTGNMVGLLATGPFLEDVYGRALYSALYLATNVAGSYADREITESGRVPSVGASAGLYGVEGAFAVRFGGSFLRFFFAPVGFLPFLGFRVRVRAVIVLLFGFLEQLFLAAEGGGELAFGAHIGGFAFGMLAAAVVWASGLERRWIHPAIEAQIGWQQNPLLDRASTARFAGKLAHARRDVRRVLAEDPKNADAWALAARLALDLGEGPEAVRCAGQAVPLFLGKGESDPAADVALEVLRKARPSLTPQFGSVVASLMERRGQTEDAVSIYEEVAARFPADDEGLRAAVRLAVLRRRGNV